MKKLGLGKRVLACAVSAASLLTGTTALSAVAQLSASAASTDNYAKLLQYSMYFYDANMCGDQVENAGQMTWRGNCHTNDAVKGGFHDAGDHVKFGLPAGYTASTLGWGYYEFKDSYDALGQTSHLRTITDYFAQYFKDCTTLSNGTVTNFVYQVGNGSQDHAEWCAPEDQSDASRQVYQTSNGASDIAAEYAAALAVNYINFGNAEDLSYAKALYEFSVKYNKTADEGTGDFYNSYDYYDDQAWAAGWLYLATKDNTYKTFLNTFMNASNQGKSGNSGCQWGVYSPMSWNNVSLGSAILQGEITGNVSDWSKVTTYLNKKCNSESTYYCEDSWGSCRYNTAMQMAALATSKYAQSGADYTSWCKAQMSMILGNNSKNANFVVGMESNSVKYAHHRAASGYASNDEMTGQVGYSSKGHTLVGALVGGPTDSNFTYQDTIQDYKCNEVALDYNAGLVGAAAGLYNKYKTGSVDATVEGTKGTQPVVTTTTEKPVVTTASSVVTTKKTTQSSKVTTTKKTTQSSKVTTTTVTTAAPSGGKDANISTGTQTGTAGDKQMYAEFAPNGAKTATLYYTLSTKDTSSSGAFGTWTGSWEQTDFEVTVGANGQCKVVYNIPSNVGQTVKAMIFYPDASSVKIDKIVLDEGSSENTTSSVTTTKRAQTQTQTNTTAAPGADDKDANISTGTQTGTAGDKQLYAEFAPNGAKSATLYYTISTKDTSSSGAFGTWTGSWEQTDFEVAVGANGQCTADYVIPSNVGQTVKAMIFYPDASSVKIDKVVLHYGNTTTPGTTAPQPSSGGKYTANVNQSVDYSKLPADDKMIGWEWSQFGIPANEKVVKVELNLSTTKKKIGKWQGAFGSSTSVAPDYWTITDDMEETFSGTSATLTWDIDSATSAVIQKEYGGMLKFGVWWIDCKQFTIDSITVYTDAYSGSSSVTTKVTTATTKTTSTSTSSTTKTTTTTKTPVTAAPGDVLYGDINLDGKVELVDAVLLNKAAADVVTLNTQQRANADCDVNNEVNANDAIVLLKFLVQIIDELPYQG